MKLIRFLIILLMAMPLIAVQSCDNNSDHQEEPLQDSRYTVQEDQQRVAQDTAKVQGPQEYNTTELKDLIDSVGKQMLSADNKLEKQINDPKNGLFQKIEKNESHIHWLWIWATAFGALNLILVSIALYRLNRVKEKYYRLVSEDKELHSEIDALRKDLNQYSTSINSKKLHQDYAPSYSVEALIKSQADPQAQLREDLSVQERANASKENESSKKNNLTIKEGYFGRVINSKFAYFKELNKSWDSETYFKAKGTDAQMEFELLNLTMAKSFDTFDNAIDFVDSPVDSKTATYFDTVKPGIAVWEDNKWVIKEKTKVRLS